MDLRFSTYCQKRKKIDEGIFDKLWGKKPGAEPETTSLDTHMGKGMVAPGARLVGQAVSAATGGGLVQAGAAALKGAAGVLSGDISSVGDIWEFIKSVGGLYSDAQHLWKSGKTVYQVMKHREALKKHLTEKRMDAKDIETITNAMFQVTKEELHNVPPPALDEAVVDFFKRLNQGYDHLEDKIFAGVLVEKLMEWVQKHFGGHADQLRAQIQALMQTSKEAETILSHPEVKQALADFAPAQGGQESPQQAQQAPAQQAQRPGTINKDTLKQKFDIDTNVPELKVGDEVMCQDMGGMDWGVITAIDENGVKVKWTMAMRRASFAQGGQRKEGEEEYIRSTDPSAGKDSYRSKAKFGIYKRYKRYERVYDPSRKVGGTVANDNDSGLYVHWDDAKQVWGAGHHQAHPLPDDYKPKGPLPKYEF